MCKRFVHHNRPRRRLSIVFIKIAPFFQRNLERAEKARSDFVVASTRPLVRRRFGVSQDREGVALGEPRGKTGDGTNGFDPRQRSNLFQQLFVKCVHRRHGLFHIPAGHTMHVLAAFRQLNAHGQKVARVESGIHALHAQDGVDQQTRADEQHHRQRHLADGESVPRGSARPGNGSPPPLPQGIVESGMRCFERRYKPKKECR